MRLLWAVTLSLTSLSLCASTDMIKILGSESDSTVVQKAQESGITFISNASQYQLILGGRAINPSLYTPSLSARQNQVQNEVLWEGANGPFNLTISNSNAGQQRAQALSNSSNYNQIAYNPRTSGIAVITGQIIVSYTDGFDSEFLEASYGIQLVQDFAHLKTAFYTVNVGQDIFLITDYLNQGGLVTIAEVEVIENFAVPN